MSGFEVPLCENCGYDLNVYIRELGYFLCDGCVEGPLKNYVEIHFGPNRRARRAGQVAISNWTPAEPRHRKRRATSRRAKTARKVQYRRNRVVRRKASALHRRNPHA